MQLTFPLTACVEFKSFLSLLWLNPWILDPKAVLGFLIMTCMLLFCASFISSFDSLWAKVFVVRSKDCLEWIENYLE